MGHCVVSEIHIGTQGWNYEAWVGPFYPRGAKAAAFEILRGGVGTIYGYFNNHYQGHSPGSANLFKRLIGHAVVDPESLVEQPSLF